MVLRIPMVKKYQIIQTVQVVLLKEKVIKKLCNLLLGYISSLAGSLIQADNFADDSLILPMDYQIHIIIYHILSLLFSG